MGLIVNQVIANTPQPLQPNLEYPAFWVFALSNNSAIIYLDHAPAHRLRVVGVAEADWRYTEGPLASALRGIPLDRGDSIVIPGPDLGRWWMDCATVNQKLFVLPLDRAPAMTVTL